MSDKTAIVIRSLSGQEQSALDQYARIFTDNLKWLPEHLQQKASLITLNAEQQKQLEVRVYDDVLAFGHREFGGQSVIENLMFQGYSYWFLCKFKVINKLLEAETAAFKVQAALEQQESDHSYDIFANSRDYEKLTESTTANSQTILRQASKKSDSGIYPILFVLRGILGFFPFLLRLFNRKFKNVLILSQTYQTKMIDPDTGGLMMGDPMFEYLLRHIRKSTDFLLLVDLRRRGANDDNISLKKKLFNKDPRLSINVESLMLLALHNPFTVLRLYRFKQFLARKTQAIQQQASSGSDQLIAKYVKHANPMLLMSKWREDAARILFACWNIKTISGINENSPLNKPLLLQAQKQGVTDIGIQHGGISNRNAFYRFHPKDKAYEPWPSYTIIRGDSIRKKFQQNTPYPQESLVILGHPRTDSVPPLLRIKSVFEAQFGIDSNKPTVLYLSQPIANPAYRLRVNQDFFKLTAAQPDFNYLIKTHPNERDLSYFKDIAEKAQTTNYSILHDDLYALLAIADVVITAYSTAGGEAIFFGKDLITLDYSNFDYMRYTADGVCLNATSAEELEQHLKTLTSSKGTIAETNKEAFVHDQAYKIDGKTAERYLDFIRSMA